MNIQQLRLISEMKSLYVNGDSWSWSKNLNYEWIWPNLVSKSLSMTCVNESVGCGSNPRILDNLHDFFITEHCPDLIIIALTSHHRYHIPSMDFGSWSVGPMVALNDRTGNTDTTIVDWIYKNSFDEIGSLYRYYRQIWQMHNLAEKYQCPVWFFQTWDTDIEDFGLMTSLENIERFVNSRPDLDTWRREKYIKAFDFFRNERQKWNYIETAFLKHLSESDIDQTLHPNEKGHRIIADKILTHIGRQ